MPRKDTGNPGEEKEFAKGNGRRERSRVKRVRKSKGKPEAAAETVVAMVRLDISGAQEEASKLYDRISGQVQELRAQLEAFRLEDKPHFVRWAHAEFGPILTVLRETQQTIRSQTEVLFEVESRIFFGASPGAAFDEVMHRRAHPEPEPEPEPEGDPGAAGRNGSAGNSGQGAYGGTEFPHGKPVRRRVHDLTGRFKQLYRAVVRRLHPDLSGGMSPQQKEYWHRAQKAYQEGRAEELETILGFLEMEDPAGAGKADLSVLRRLSEQLKRTVRQLRLELSECRKDPAWGFSKRKDLRRYAERMRQQLEIELLQLRSQLEQIEHQLALWKAEAEQRRVGRRRG